MQLSQICEYVREKVDVAELSVRNYISTENMKPQKDGITKATSLPSTNQTQAFQKNDVLVSNIRPYFKKIWYAEYAGGCSNDVLVFRAKKGTDAHYLYYVLANDSFFDYAMLTSKGTKMPRGDKVAIMKYSVPEFEIEVQQKIVKILSAIDEKIKINEQINKNLVA